MSGRLPPPRPGAAVTLLRFLVDATSAPRTRQALTVLILVVSLASPALQMLLGWPGHIGVVGTLVTLATLSLWGQREEIEWRGVLPISLLAFFGWIALSVVWSSFTWASVGGISYAFAFAYLAVYIALSRDLIQMVRAAGDALRGILVTSLAVEVLSGIVLDVPFGFLSVEGNLAFGGPIQGVAGTRNYLCFLAGLAVMTFWIEFRTRSVRRMTSVASLVLAAGTVLLARSPVTLIVLIGIAVAGVALMLVRRTTPERRAIAQPVLFGIVALLAAGAWIARRRILDVVNAGSDLEVRLRLWNSLRELIDTRPVEGWGWVGRWPVEVFPFSSIRTTTGGQADSALNALFDAWFQIGVVGTILLVVAVGLGFVRAWLVASEFRSTVHVWPALTLALLAATSFAESYVLAEGGLVLMVVACISAARKRSWRQKLR